MASENQIVWVYNILMECIGFLLLITAPLYFFGQHYQWKYRNVFLLTTGIGIGILAEAFMVWFRIQGLSLP